MLLSRTSALQRRISSCQTGVRSGPALVSQNVMVTGPVLVFPEVPLPPLELLPHATATIASKLAATTRNLDCGTLIACSPPIPVYSVHEVTRTIMAAVPGAVNSAGILGARTAGPD